VADRRPKAAVALLLVLTVARGLIYVLVIPPWQTPDEPSHFAYVSFIRYNHRLPGSAIIPVSKEILASMSDCDFWKLRYDTLDPASVAEPHEFRVATGHPPLYYLVGTLLLIPLKGDDIISQLYALRLGSVLMAASTVLVAYWTVKLLFPDDAVLPFAVSAFIIFLPMHTFMSASVNNDNLAELVASLVVFLLVLLLRDGMSPLKGLGVVILLAAGLLTKRTTFFTVPLALAFTPIYCRTRAYSIRDASLTAQPQLASLASHAATARRTILPSHRLRYGLTVVVLLGLISGTLWTFVTARRVGRGDGATVWIEAAATQRQYLPLSSKQPGAPPANPAHVMAVAVLRFLRVSPGQLQSAFSRDTLSLPRVRSYLLFSLLTFASFWANFGWMNVPLDPPWYALLAVISLLAFFGLLVRILREIRSSGEQSLLPCRWQKGALLILILASFLIFVQTFGSMVVQNIPQQGRYLFPAIVPLSTLFMLGLSEVVPKRYRHRLALVCVLSLSAFDALCLTRYILPHYYA